MLLFYNNRFRHLLILLFGTQLLFFSCREDMHSPVSTGHLQMTDDTLINYNRKVVTTEDQEIGAMVSRYRWQMQKSSTGLRYMIYQHGNGLKAMKNKSVVFQYDVRLINGTFCYSSEKNGPKEVRLGHGEIERGLEEGILLMKVGDRAKFIVPSHLAFGLLGDQARIPPGATLVYDVRLLKVK